MHRGSVGCKENPTKGRLLMGATELERQSWIPHPPPYGRWLPPVGMTTELLMAQGNRTQPRAAVLHLKNWRLRQVGAVGDQVDLAEFDAFEAGDVAGQCFEVFDFAFQNHGQVVLPYKISRQNSHYAIFALFSNLFLIFFGTFEKNRVLRI